MARSRQRGFVLLLVLLVLMVAGAALFVTARAPGDADRAGASAADAAALAEARRALIARALADDNRPGSLPCPDADNDGSADLFAGNDCPSNMGRLPYRTLDVPNVRDTTGQRLWYVIDPAYRDHDSAEPVNPLGGAALTFNGQPDFVAAVIAPGSPVHAGQDARPGTDPSDYLEGENLDGDDNFQDCSEQPDCNDSVNGIGVDQFFELVQRRVLREVEQVLRDYYAANGYLPYAADFGSIECVNGNHLGQLPLVDGDGDCGGATETLEESDFPVWIRSEAQGGNDWLDLVVYHVDSECTQPGVNCAAATMTLDTAAGLQSVVAAAGRALGGQARPGSGVADYLDDAENTDGDADYVERPLGPADNDVLRGVRTP